MSESTPNNIEQNRAPHLNVDESLNHLVSLVGNKRRILCIGGSTISLAKTLRNQMSCDVTILIDPSDHISLDATTDIKIIIESIGSDEIIKRFSSNDFEVIFVADSFHQIRDYGVLLSRLIAHFSGSLIISAPQIEENTQLQLAVQAKEISRLKDLIETKDKSIAWHTKRLREHLLNHYKLEKTARERIEEDEKNAQKLHYLSETIKLKEHSYKLLEGDRDRILAELNRVKRYSPDSLPAILKYPLKSFIGIYSNGILEPFKSLKKKLPSVNQNEK